MKSVLSSTITTRRIWRGRRMYKYGMRLRGFSIGCQPMQGFVKRVDDESGVYYDILIYDRKLSEEEIKNYELDYLREYYD